MDFQEKIGKCQMDLQRLRNEMSPYAMKLDEIARRREPVIVSIEKMDQSRPKMGPKSMKNRPIDVLIKEQKGPEIKRVKMDQN